MDIVLPENPVRIGDYIWGVEMDSGRNVLLSQKAKCSSSAEANELKRSTPFADLASSHHALISFSSTFHISGRSLLLSAPPLRMDLGNCSALLNSTYSNGFPEPALRLILNSLLNALCFLHSLQIIHRAICAENIWLDSAGQIRLAMTRHAIRISDCPKWIGVENRVQEFNSDQEEMIAWLAPEVLMQDLNGYGTESDLYSVGICLCELGNGVVPFQEMEPLRVLYEKLSGSTPVLLDSTNCNDEEFEQPRTFSKALHDFVGELFEHKRPSASQLLQKYGESLFSDDLSPETLVDHLPLAKRFVQ